GTMAAVTGRVHAGVTLQELVEQVEHEMRSRGSLTPSFTTHIFTCGLEDGLESRGPCAVRPLRDGEAVLFGFGAVLDGYCSDFGRTIFWGEPPAGDARAYAAILAAPEGGPAGARPRGGPALRKRAPPPPR